MNKTGSTARPRRQPSPWFEPFSPAERDDLIVIASVAKQSILSSQLHGLLRGACHRVRIRATRWLAMTAGYTSAFPRRITPELCMNLSPNKGRGECRVPVAPAASCAKCSKAHELVTTVAPGSPGIPARDGFNSLFRALPGDRACLPPSPRGVASAKLDASVGASGPHDFAVRKIALSSAAPPASIASQPYVRDDRETPLVCGPGCERYRSDLGQKRTGIFLRRGLDRRWRNSPRAKSADACPTTSHTTQLSSPAPESS